MERGREKYLTGPPLQSFLIHSHRDLMRGEWDEGLALAATRSFQDLGQHRNIKQESMGTQQNHNTIAIKNASKYITNRAC